MGGWSALLLIAVDAFLALEKVLFTPFGLNSIPLPCTGLKLYHLRA